MTDHAQPIGPAQPDAGGAFLCLWEFFELFVVMQGLELPLKQAHREACDVLQDAVLGELTRIDRDTSEPIPFEFIIVNIPPRVGKTKLMQALACWMIAYFPDAQIIFTSYSGPLAEESLAYIAKVLQAPWFIELFGDKLHGKKADHLTTASGGNVYGEGTGGELTGKGGGLKRPCGGFICIDDPAKPDEALSPVVSESVRRWFETTLKDRRNSDRHCPIIICAQRLAPDDLPGYILKTYPDDTKLIKFAALLPDNTSAFPETISAKTLLNYQKTRIGRFVLASKYQQEPTSLGGNLIQTAAFPRYSLGEVEGFEWEELIMTCDTAMKIKQWNDSSCVDLWGRFKNRAYLLDQIHGKWESPELLSCSITFFNKCRDRFPQTVLRFVIEEKAAGTGLVQQLNVAGIPAEGIERDIDKVRRVKAVLPYIEAGMVFLPKDGETPWIEATLNEYAEFKEDGTAVRDDRVDTLADGVQLTLGRSISILDVLGGKE